MTITAWLERSRPSRVAAASLREGLAEMFTVNRLGLPPSLRRCLVSNNLIESPHSRGALADTAHLPLPGTAEWRCAGRRRCFCYGQDPGKGSEANCSDDPNMDAPDECRLAIVDRPHCDCGVNED